MANEGPRETRIHRGSLVQVDWFHQMLRGKYAAAGRYGSGPDRLETEFAEQCADLLFVAALSRHGATFTEHCLKSSR